MYDPARLLVAELVPVPAVAPVNPSGRPGEATVNARRVPGVAELVDEDLPLVGNSVIVGVLKPPDVGRRGDVESSAKPGTSHRKRHLVGEESCLIKTPIAVGVLEHPHRVRKLLFELRRTEIHASILGDKQPTSIIKTGHRRVSHQRRRRGNVNRISVRNRQLRRLKIGLGRKRPGLWLGVERRWKKQPGREPDKAAGRCRHKSVSRTVKDNTEDTLTIKPGVVQRGDTG